MGLCRNFSVGNVRTKDLDPQAAPSKQPKNDFSRTVEMETDEIRIKSNLAKEIEIQMNAHLDRIRRDSSAIRIHHSFFLKHLDLLRNLDSTAYVVNTIVTQMIQLEGKHNHILTDWRKFPHIIISVSSISASPLEARYLFPRGYLHHLEDLFRQCAYTELDLPFANWVCTWSMMERKIHLTVFPSYKATGDEKQFILAHELMTEVQRAYMGGQLIS